MNYLKIYQDIVKYRQENKPTGDYLEHHHIIPRCLKGPNRVDNIIIVTTKEHYILHHLLTKIYPNHLGIKRAYRFIINRLNIEKATCPYTCIRKQQYSLKNIYSIPIVTSPEFKQKISKIHKGKPKSQEQKLKMAAAKKGKKFTEEHKRRISESCKATKRNKKIKNY